jgi:Na+-driven multidrug efflux pump
MSNVLNLVLAVLLVYGPGHAPPVFSWGPPVARALGLPRMELEGAAWATIIARSFTLVPLIAIVVWRYHLFRRDARARPDRALIGTIWRIAWPSSTQLVIRITGMLVTQTLVARAFTTPTDQSATTALGIVFRLETMALFVGLGWGSAAQTFMGQNLGAGRKDRAVGSGWIAAVYNLVAMAILFVAYHFYGAPLVRFFDDSPVVVGHALGYLLIVAPSYAALGIGIVLGSAMTGAGATRTTMKIDGLVVFAFQLPAAVLAVTLGTPVPSHLWYVLFAANVVGAALYIVLYRRGTFLFRGSLPPPPVEA